jgi:hypothetical protein
MSVIDTASRVLREEAAAVLGLQKKLDDSFEMAVNMIASASGRVKITLPLADAIILTAISKLSSSFFCSPSTAEGLF